MKGWTKSARLSVMCGLTLGAASAASAQAPALTAQTVIDRAEIADLITRYYYNLGRSSANSFAAFYTDDAELILGAQSFKGREGIESAYKGTADSPQRKAYAFSITISNPLVTVRGDTATARIIFTEFLTDKQGDPPRVYVQGREYDWLVKQDGRWRIKKRQIMPGSQLPEGWSD